MKAVILAGGLGTRLSEETDTKPKPMVEIGGKPILWHIMKTYSAHGVNDFIICCGYKGYVIKEYFANYFLHTSDVTFSIKNNEMHVHQNNSEPWTVTLVDTGDETMTGGRLKRIREYVKDESAFCFTYGDGVGNVNISKLILFHYSTWVASNAYCNTAAWTLWGAKLKSNINVDSFQEKPDGDGSWINGGFFVMHPDVINRVQGDHSIWETDILPDLAKDGQLAAFRHAGFWQPMDTLREKNYLNELWRIDDAPWKVW